MNALPMPNPSVYDELLRKFRGQYGRAPDVVAYAPGRIEVLGNHTDYNEGFVLSAAIDCGTFFAAATSAGGECRLMAGDLMHEVAFPVRAPVAAPEHGWSNYVKGVLAGLNEAAPGGLKGGFDALFLGNIPLGSGLSSSAALEMSAGLALARLYGLALEPVALARIGQAAEHRFAGVKCGLLDQISSLYGRAGKLVETDFRTLTVKTVPLGTDVCFLMCNTHARHALVDGEYNRRRQDCEAAAAYFARVLPGPVKALRDVTWADWQAHQGGLGGSAARRAAHPIGENARVLAGAQLLAACDLSGFGRLMFESHESSRVYFENSCPELDAVVAAAARTPGVLGARLSGGGFGGSVVVLLHPRDAADVAAVLAREYALLFGRPCETRVIQPSDGARVIADAGTTR